MSQVYFIHGARTHVYKPVSICWVMIWLVSYWLSSFPRIFLLVLFLHWINLEAGGNLKKISIITVLMQNGTHDHWLTVSCAGESVCVNKYFIEYYCCHV